MVLNSIYTSVCICLCIWYNNGAYNKCLLHMIYTEVYVLWIIAVVVVGTMYLNCMFESFKFNWMDGHLCMKKLCPDIAHNTSNLIKLATLLLIFSSARSALPINNKRFRMINHPFILFENKVFCTHLLYKLILTNLQWVTIYSFPISLLASKVFPTKYTQKFKSSFVV